MMADRSVLLQVEDGIGSVTLNRPDVLNALDFDMAGELVRTLQQCMEDAAVRVVLLTGTGRGFCAGGDMKAAWQHIQAGGDPRHFFRDLTLRLHRAITDMRLMAKPIIAAINGAAGGAGMSLAAACDLRIASESAKFRQAYTSIGLVPDGGWTAIVPHIVGQAKAMELLLLDPVLDAREALAMGLVHEVVPNAALMGRAHQVAAALAAGPATAFGEAKTLASYALGTSLEVQLERERQAIIRQATTPDFREGLSAFIEKRGPLFLRR